jgi:peroxiredoxin Q/BCP
MSGLLRRLMSAGRATSAPPKMLDAGAAAPGFRVKAHTGETVALGDFRGRKVVLWFYPKADTPGCTVEGKGFCSAHAELDSHGVTILGVSFDDEAANRAFAAKFGFPYPLLCDTDRRIGMAYGACDDASAKHARRISYLIDESGRISHAFAKVDPGTHTAEILALVR